MAPAQKILVVEDEPDIRKLAAEAGFRYVTRVMPEDAMLSFFLLRA